MGQHSVERRDESNITPDGAPPPRGPARRAVIGSPKVLTVLGSITAAIVIIGVLTAALGGSGRPAPPAGGTSAAASPAPSFASHLAQLPEYTALTGSAAVAWADAALTALGAPRTTANVQTMMDWFTNEGTPHDLNNPLNLQTPFGGSTIDTTIAPESVGLQDYPTPADFVAAFPIEMNNGSYPAIVAALKAGKGLEGSAATAEIAAELSLYSGGGYSSIPAAYNQ